MLRNQRFNLSFFVFIYCQINFFCSFSGKKIVVNGFDVHRNILNINPWHNITTFSHIYQYCDKWVLFHGKVEKIKHDCLFFVNIELSLFSSLVRGRSLWCALLYGFHAVPSWSYLCMFLFHFIYLTVHSREKTKLKLFSVIALQLPAVAVNKYRSAVMSCSTLTTF